MNSGLTKKKKKKTHECECEISFLLLISTSENVVLIIRTQRISNMEGNIYNRSSVCYFFLLLRRQLKQKYISTVNVPCSGRYSLVLKFCYSSQERPDFFSVHLKLLLPVYTDYTHTHMHAHTYIRAISYFLLVLWGKI